MTYELFEFLWRNQRHDLAEEELELLGIELSRDQPEFLARPGTSRLHGCPRQRQCQRSLCAANQIDELDLYAVRAPWDSGDVEVNQPARPLHVQALPAREETRKRRPPSA